MKISLVELQTIAEGTIEFRFARPAGFSYKAGQSADLTLIGVPVTDSFGNSRSFSLSSAPHEAELAIASRMRDTAFKNFLKTAPKGTEVVLDGPFGSFFLHENANRPAIFIAGGIGITPFRSMIVDATHRALPHLLTLFYSNRTPDAPFLNELTELTRKNPNFKLVSVETGREGHLDAEKIKEHASLEASPIFYIAGPTKMVFALRDLLNSMDVSNDDIKFEEFAGY